jgi:outer membrane protein OmpA-like peptidoglycan-associated protein
MNKGLRIPAAIAILAAGTAAAGCVPTEARVTPQVRIVGAAGPPAALTVIVNTSSPADLDLLRRMIILTARPGEHLIAVSSAAVAVLGSFAAPRPLTRYVPGPPRAPTDPTAFQAASYRRARTAYSALLSRDRTRLRLRQLRGLRTWAARSARRVVADVPRLSPRGSVATAISTAVTAVATLQETGVRTATRRVIVIFGLSGAIASGRHVDLSGSAVVVADDSDAAGTDSSLQADLLADGASSATVLGPATDGQLPAVVARGLRGTVSYQLTRISYGPAQYRLPVSAATTLRTVLRLLTTRYPASTATVNGYTDDIPVRGGNAELSWKRAEAVVSWLTRHGVAASRLLAVGHGAADPLVPNGPDGQPRNRRVVIVIEPGT